MSMPDGIELPNAEDFCRHQLFKDKQCCFTGWRIKLLPDMDWQEENEFEQTALKVAKQMKLKFPRYTRSVDVSNYNDWHANSDWRLSTWFRKTIEQLGYDIS